MHLEFIQKVSTLRLVIGYLGEKDHFAWWHSSFFTTGSDAFLSPLFGRTQLLAQCNGITKAAANIHDERIGIGNVFHLFRLPEDMEQKIHSSYVDGDYKNFFVNKDAALKYLMEFSVEPQQVNEGPTMVANTESLYDHQIWQLIAGAYLHGFEHEYIVFPYFSDVL